MYNVMCVHMICYVWLFYCQLYPVYAYMLYIPWLCIIAPIFSPCFISNYLANFNNCCVTINFIIAHLHVFLLICIQHTHLLKLGRTLYNWNCPMNHMRLFTSLYMISAYCNKILFNSIVQYPASCLDLVIRSIIDYGIN